MVQNPPPGMPRITPYLFYNDVTEALEWLSKVFDLEVRFTMPGADGKPMHAEMAFADGIIMMGPARPDQGSQSPSDLRAVNQGLYIYVSDVDAHYRKAKEAGAEIAIEPADMFWGDRMYAARDLEGHTWTFAQHVKDVAPEDMQVPEDWS